VASFSLLSQAFSMLPWHRADWLLVSERKHGSAILLGLHEGLKPPVGIDW